MVQSLWKSLAISYKTKHTITTWSKITNSLVFTKMNWKLLSTQKPVQFIAALFITAKTWKQPKGPSVGEQINCETSKRILFNVKKKKLLSHKKTWRNLKCTLLSEINQYEKATWHMIPIIWHSKKGKNMETVKRSMVASGHREGRMNR